MAVEAVYGLAVDAVPENVDMNGIRNYLEGLENVSAYHDLHVWPLNTTETALTVHLIIGENVPER